MDAKYNRRNFLKQGGMLGVGLTVGRLAVSAMPKERRQADKMDYEYVGNVSDWNKEGKEIRFNCSGKQTVRISILTENMFRVRFSVDGTLPASRMNEQWSLVRSDNSYPTPKYTTLDEESTAWINTAEIRIKINKIPFRINVFDNRNRLLTKESSSPGMGGGNGAYLQMDKSADEHFFGMGEGIGTKNPDALFKLYRYPQYKNVSINGMQLEDAVITLDQTGKKTFFNLGPNWSGQCMAPAVIPFFMSTKGYGIYLNNFRDSVFDLGNTNKNSWSVALGGAPNYVPNTDSLDYYFIHGPSFKKILDEYTGLTGKTTLLPKWSLGYFQICDFNQTQAEVLKIAQDFRKKDFPCDMLSLEPGWMKTPYHMDGWSPERFPDPDAMIAELTNLGFKLGLWQCGPADWVFIASLDLVKRNVNQWAADITNPADVKKYIGYHLPYYDHGISFFKQDGCGQSEWQPDEPYHNGLTGKEMHNIIPTLYSKIIYEGYKKHTGKRYVNFSPMVGPSQQQYPGIWPSGDSGGGYEMFVGELNLGMSGHTYTSHDFTDYSPAGIHWSLLGPWMPGALSAAPYGDIPGIRISRKPPDTLSANMCQLYLKLRYKLIPYIYTTHWQAYKSGIPYRRAMVLEYQEDRTSYNLDHQCMLGDWFLMAAYTHDIYLPAGKWFDYWTGEEFESVGEWKRNHGRPDTVGGLLLVKGGAIIPTSQAMAFIDKEPLDIVVLDIYPYQTSAYALYEDDGTTYDYETGACATTRFNCRQTQSNILISIDKRDGTYNNMPKNRSYLLSVHCQTVPVKISKGTQTLIQHKTKEELVSDGAKKGWFYDRQRKIVWIKPMVGWYYGSDERGDSDPEKDTVYWINKEKQEEEHFKLYIKLSSLL